MFNQTLTEIDVQKKIFVKSIFINRNYFLFNKNEKIVYLKDSLRSGTQQLKQHMGGELGLYRADETFHVEKLKKTNS